MTNYAKQTQISFKGRLDPGYLTLTARPETTFRPRTLRLPMGVEVAVSGEWKGLSHHDVPISSMAPCGPPSTFELHLRNLTGHPIEGVVAAKGLSPKDPAIGRRKVVGRFNVYQQDDTT